MRNKNDVCIKYYQLRKLHLLTNEEVGILLKSIIIDVDTDEQRYENSDKKIVEILRKYDEKTKREHEEKRNGNMTYMTTYNDILEQIRYSEKKFNEIKERRKKETTTKEQWTQEETEEETREEEKQRIKKEIEEETKQELEEQLKKDGEETTKDGIKYSQYMEWEKTGEISHEQIKEEMTEEEYEKYIEYCSYCI